MVNQNCLYCENIMKNLKGKLYVEVKNPDMAVIPANITIVDNKCLFRVELISGSSFIYDVTTEMNITLEVMNKKYVPDVINVSPDKFTHIIVDYEYIFCNNQPRIKRVVLKKIDHISKQDLYKI